MIRSADCFRIFEQSVADYHRINDVDQPFHNPYKEESFEALCYLKNWIDTIQWHLEDIVRDPQIDPVKGLELKRRIDRSNQHRTDVVEQMDDHFISHFTGITPKPEARLNSETPAWLLDRMSILILKIWHMHEQTLRTDVDTDHIVKCTQKLATLEEQKSDMAGCFDELLEDVGKGTRRIKVYRQMKMYNDTSLNPILYKTKS